MTNRLLYTLFLFILMTSCPAQSLRIAFYNVENAFDTLRSPGKDDAEFTPQGEKRWDMPGERRPEGYSPGAALPPGGLLAHRTSRDPARPTQ